MGRQSHFTVSVSGGDTEENQTIAGVIHTALMSRGFLNSTLDTHSETPNSLEGLSLGDCISAVNPELFSAPVSIVAEVSYEQTSLESRAIAQMVQTATGSSRFGRWN